jgi:hypothetical protein
MPPARCSRWHQQQYLWHQQQYLSREFRLLTGQRCGRGGGGVDMMDPEFWAKVVGLKQQGVEVQMQELAGCQGGRRGRRGRDDVVS